MLRSSNSSGSEDKRSRRRKKNTKDLSSLVRTIMQCMRYRIDGKQILLIAFTAVWKGEGE